MKSDGEGLEAGYQPLVSIIMPVHNESQFIKRSLDALLRQSYPPGLIEVIVADGMSTDDTREIVAHIAASTKVPVYIVDNPKRIAPSGLNCALKRATGDIVIRVDGHCEVETDYVKNCVALLLSGKADGVGGPIETVGEGLRSQGIALAMSSTFGVGGSAFRTINDREMYTDTVAFPGYTRKIIERAGSFNEELVRNQDDEYNYRIREIGGKILLSPTIRSRYYSRTTFTSLWRQYFQYGYWKVRVLQLHPRQMRFPQFVPFIFVTTIIMLAAFSLFFSFARWIMAAEVLAYLFVNVGVALCTTRTKLVYAPVLSLSFFILHFSYGLGSVAGLIDFCNRWGEPSD